MPKRTENVNVKSAVEAQSLYSSGKLGELAEDLIQYSNLEGDFATALIIGGYGWEVADYIESFDAEFHAAICEDLISSGYTDAILVNLDRFDSVDQLELIKKMIRQGEGRFPLFVLHYFREFDDFERLEIAQEFFDQGCIQELEEFGILLDQIDATEFDYGQRGKVELRATLINSSRVIHEGSNAPTIEQGSILEIALDDEVISGQTPDETIERAIARSANGFESWRGKTDIAKRSFQSDLETAISEISQISRALVR